MDAGSVHAGYARLVQAAHRGGSFRFTLQPGPV
jgi:hypothetical protein